MTRFYGFELESGICRTFTNVAALRDWLKRKNCDSGSPEAFPNGWRGILMKEMKLVCMANNMIFGPVWSLFEREE